MIRRFNWNIKSLTLGRKSLLMVMLSAGISHFPLKGQVVINEILAAPGPATQNADIPRGADWIELYNTSDTVVDMGGYFITDDVNQPSKFRVPENMVLKVGQYMLFVSDSAVGARSLPFGFSRKGEMAVLLDPEYNVVDLLDFPEQYSGISYGRKEGDAGFFAVPTPGRANTLDLHKGISPSPEISPSPGNYSSGRKVEISFELESDTQIYFTLDGSVPDSGDTPYLRPFSLESTAVVRSIAYKTGCLPSRVITNTFIIEDRDSFLPVVSLAVEPEDFFSDTSGIYVVGTNGVTGFCNNRVKRNYCRDWERAVHMEFFPESALGYSAPAGIKIHGNCSRNFPQRSLALFARGIYGEADFDYPFFTERKYLSYEALVLRNSGNDFGRSMIRDGLMSRIVSGYMDVDYSAYQPVRVYLNGEYWGLYNLREKLNEHFPSALYGLDTESINLFENDGQQIHGSRSGIRYIREYLEDTIMSVKEKFEKLSAVIDMDSFIDYILAQVYSANMDWPGKNIKFWNTADSKGKIRWILYDVDLGLGLQNGNYDTDMFRYLLNDYKREEKGFTQLMFYELSRYSVFREQLSSRGRELLTDGLDSQRLTGLVNEITDRIRSEMPYHRERWRISGKEWEDEIESILEFVNKRSRYLSQQLKQYEAGTYSR